MKELTEIQSALRAPKNQRNTFGRYNYRSAEDILEAVKPLLHQHGCTLLLSDDIEQVGNRYYVRATAIIRNANGETETVSALAREEETRKGMDAAQVTGSTSSYARKYALNGLFCIDDCKDPDQVRTKPDLPGDLAAQIQSCTTSAALAALFKGLTPEDQELYRQAFTQRKNQL